MDTIGLDLHKRESQLCILTEVGEILERRIHTSQERFTAVLGARPPARILLEASTESEWVARHWRTSAILPGEDRVASFTRFVRRQAPGSALAQRRGWNV